jgi:GAF domain-containing protein/HAMP domain-containing protein
MIKLLNRLPGSLNVRLALGFMVMAVVPSVVLLIVTFLWMSNNATRTYEALLVETAARRQAVINGEFDDAFSTLEGFTSQPVTFQLLYNALVFRSTTSATGATNRLASLINTPGQDRFDSAWLLNRDGIAIASATRQGEILPFINTDRSSSVSYAEAERMAEEGDLLYKVVVENGDDSNVTVNVISVMRDTGRRPIGYLIAQMSLDTLFLQHFRSSGGVPVQGFVLPSGSEPLTVPEQQQEAKFVSSSPPVLRALNGEAPRLEGYKITDADGSQKDVIGYAQQVVVTGTPFVLLTQMHVADIVQETRTYVQITAFPLILGGLFLAGVLFVLLRYVISNPLSEMANAMRAMGRGIMDVNVPAAQRQDELGDLARLFVDVRQQTAQSSLSMTQKLRERERDVRVTQSIIQALAGERDLQSLMNRVVVLIVENFPMIYHAQIFLTDSENYAVLRASTGEVGQQLMSRGHRLAVGSVSVIGQSVQQRQAIIARDTSSSELHRRNEFLPDTRAEVAIPLIINQEVVGALDVQSKERDAFTEDMLTVMHSLAAQISIALENVRLYEDSQRHLSQSHLDQRVDVGREWTGYVQAYRRRRLTERAGNATGYDFTALRTAAIKKGSSVVGEITSRGTIPFVVLIQLRGQPLGALEFELPQVDFHYDKVLLAEELSNRLAVSLDNARLFQESRKAAERERTVNTISAQLTSKTDINEILQMAIQEVGLALHSSQVAIQLNRPSSNEPAKPADEETSPTLSMGSNGHSHD